MFTAPVVGHMHVLGRELVRVCGLHSDYAGRWCAIVEREDGSKASVPVHSLSPLPAENVFRSRGVGTP